ncbi:MAG: hypothetical protein PVH40_08425, partial [Gemmatimonadales bacterium]
MMRISVIIGLVVSLAPPASGQLIGLKTVPVAAGDQFFLAPSDNAGMGGVAIALDDTLRDPFVNPAKGARVGLAQLFAAPTYYNVSDNAGSAGALSAGALFGGTVFGGGMVSIQQLKRGDEFFRPWFGPEIDVLPPDALGAQSATNKYGFVTIGAQAHGDLAIAASGFFADLNAMDGVEHLYAMSSAIDQSGSIKDVRVGATKTFEGGRTFEALGLFRRFDMRHDVTYVDWVLVDSTTWDWERQVRTEENLDKTDTW